MELTICSPKKGIFHPNGSFAQPLGELQLTQKSICHPLKEKFHPLKESVHPRMEIVNNRIEKNIVSIEYAQASQSTND